MDVMDILKQKVESMEDEMVDYAKQLISYPSTSGKEYDAQLFVKSVLEDLGFNDIDLWEPDIEDLKDHEAFISSRSNFNNSPNVVGTLNGSGEGKSIILNSHIDVVPEGDKELWTHHPYKAVVKDGLIYGRGVSDMKGTKAAIFIALKALQEIDIKLQGNVVFQSVIEEETGSAGTLACALKGYSADAAIIPEPSAFKICPAQQGSAWFRIQVDGKAAHGGTRYHGVSAIENACYLLETLKELESIRNKKYKNELYAGNPIPFCINVGKLNGGEWPSSVAEKAIIEGRLGIPPGETIDSAKASLEEWIKESSSKIAYLKDYQPKVEWFGAFWGSSAIDRDHPIVLTAKSAYRQVFSKEATIIGTPWATDARILTEFANTPALVFGPGITAHCPDEHISVKSLKDYALILANILVNWCGVEDQ